jgi:phenylpropionate dioxygenase-like ring-hydroxylating dioxygenase large terminal subunit
MLSPELDPAIFNDWHPVADASAVIADKLIPASLLGQDLALFRDKEGAIHAWEDRCPHRGTRFSIGRIDDGKVVCAYHAWQFQPSGQCTYIPALPEHKPAASVCAKTFAAKEQYGLVWVCLGTPAADVLPFPEHADARLNKVICGPYDVPTSAPRIVENFLDMAHFPYIHTGILGDPSRTEVRDYKVDSHWEDGAGGTGVRATECFFWQPQTNSLAHGGTEVEYSYRVVRPYTAILTKVPEGQEGFWEAISLHVQPLTEETSRVWLILALTNFVQSDDELRAFQDKIFSGDMPILQNQVPKRLPLAPGAEMPMRCDRLSQAYRRYLTERGVRFGVIPA